MRTARGQRRSFLIGALLLPGVAAATVAAFGQTGGGSRWRYGDTEPPQWRHAGPEVDVRVAHAPKATFHIVMDDDGDLRVSPCFAVPVKDPKARVELPISDRMHTEPVQDCKRWWVSPTERYLLSDQFVGRGINAVMLFVRTGGGGDGPHYRLASPDYLSDRAAAMASHEKVELLGSEYYFVPLGWHGAQDRYLDFKLDRENGPSPAWVGSYDTQSGRFLEDKKPAFAPSDPRAPGEKFPETRSRLLTDAEVAGWSYARVRYAINEIYARHGYPFPDNKGPIVNQFSKFDWYRPDFSLKHEADVDSRLSPLEKKNLLILARRRDALRRAGAR